MRHLSQSLFALLVLFLAACSHLSAADNPSEIADPSVTYFNQHLAPSRKNGKPIHLSEGYVDYQGSRMHYVMAGEGKPLVFYHGFPGFWFIWKYQLAELAKDYRVIAVDGLGANLSDKPSDISAYRIDRLSNQLGHTIRTLLGDEPYMLIGHDWGGALAWAYAQQNPPGLEKLVVIGAPPYNQFLNLLQHNPDQRKASAYVDRLKSTAAEERLGADNALEFWRIGGYEKMAKSGVISKQESELYRIALARDGALRGGLNWYRANVPAFSDIKAEHFWPSENARTNVESMLIWGEQDRVFVTEFIDQLPEYAPNLRVELLPELGHVPQLRAPEQVNKLIKEFAEQP